MDGNPRVKNRSACLENSEKQDNKGPNKINTTGVKIRHLMKSAWWHKELLDKLRDKKNKYKKWKDGLVARAEYQQIV